MRAPLVAGIIIALLLMVGGYLLLGLPGGFYALAAAPVAELLRGLPQGSLLDGERAWPVAIMMSLAVPPALPVSIALQGWLRPRAGWLEATLWIVGGVYLWAVIVMVVLA